MNKTIKQIFIFVFTCSSLFYQFSLNLKGFDLKNVEFYNCSQLVDHKRDTLANDAFDALEEALNRAKECLPKDLFDRIFKSLAERTLTIYIDCRPNCDCFMRPDGCGGTPQPKGKLVGLFIMLHFENIYMNSQCGCVEAVILHELLHWGAGLSDSKENEKKAYGCEEKCFPDCAKDRKGVEPEDCCDK